MWITLFKWYGSMLGIAALFAIRAKIRTESLIKKVNDLNIDKFDLYSNATRLAEFKGVTFEKAVKALLDSGDFKTRDETRMNIEIEVMFEVMSIFEKYKKQPFTKRVVDNLYRELELVLGDAITEISIDSPRELHDAINALYKKMDTLKYNK